MPVKVDWKKKARVLLQLELARKDVGYPELSLALKNTCGVFIEPKVLSNKVGRGTFSLAFFLQCMHSLGVDKIIL